MRELIQTFPDREKRSKVETFVRGVAVVAALLTFISASAFAQGRGQSFNRGVIDQEQILQRFEIIAKQLELSEGQQREIRGLIESFLAEHRSEIDQLSQLQDRLKEARMSENRDETKTIVIEMKSTGKSLREDGRELRKSVVALLDREQKAKAAELLFDSEGRAKERGKGDRRHCGPCGIKRADLAEKLGLTEEQHQQIKEIREAFKSEHASELERTKELRQGLKSARKEGDAEQMETVRNQINEQRASLREARQEMRQQLMQVLTEEQREMLKNLCGDASGNKGEATGKDGTESSAESTDSRPATIE